jgi:hypothetical protein
MTERAQTGANDDRERGRRTAGTPVEYVRKQCPVLIATLVAMARAPRHGQVVDDNAAARLPGARWQERLGDVAP